MTRTKTSVDIHWWVPRALIVFGFVLVGLLSLYLLAGSEVEHDVIDVVCLAFLVLMACAGLIFTLLLQILEKVANLEKRRRG